MLGCSLHLKFKVIQQKHEKGLIHIFLINEHGIHYEFIRTLGDPIDRLPFQKNYYDKRLTQSLEVPSFFFTNNLGASQGDLLGFIYPLFKKSLNCCFNFSYLTKENR